MPEGASLNYVIIGPSDHHSLCRVVPNKGPTKEVPIAEIHPEFYHIGKRLRSQKTGVLELTDQDIITLEDGLPIGNGKIASNIDGSAPS